MTIMIKKYALIYSILSFTIITCTTQQVPVPPRSRNIDPSEVQGYHKKLEVTIAWYPYQNEVLTRSDDGVWQIVKADSGKVGNIPVILIKYPTGDSVWLDMNTKNADLGNLLKHTLMTQEPIKYPLADYLEATSCTKCHPSDVEVDFNR